MKPFLTFAALMAGAICFADHVREYFFDGGALTPEASTARFLARKNEMDLAIIAESARWGDFLTPDDPDGRRSRSAAKQRLVPDYGSAVLQPAGRESRLRLCAYYHCSRGDDLLYARRNRPARNRGSGVYSWDYAASTGAWSGAQELGYMVNINMSRNAWTGLFLYDYDSVAWVQTFFAYRRDW